MKDTRYRCHYIINNGTPRAKQCGNYIHIHSKTHACWIPEHAVSNTIEADVSSLGAILNTNNTSELQENESRLNLILDDITTTPTILAVREVINRSYNLLEVINQSNLLIKAIPLCPTTLACRAALFLTAKTFRNLCTPVRNKKPGLEDKRENIIEAMMQKESEKQITN